MGYGSWEWEWPPHKSMLHICTCFTTSTGQKLVSSSAEIKSH